MQENPLLYAQLSLQVVCGLFYFKVMLNIFEFSRVSKNVES